MSDSRLSMLRAAFATFVAEHKASRRMYSEQNKRKSSVSLATRQNIAWTILSRAIVGDVLRLTFVGREHRFYRIENIITEKQNTHVVCVRLDDASGDVLNFSWKDYKPLGIQGVAFALDAEIASCDKAKQPTKAVDGRKARHPRLQRAKAASKPSTASIVREAAQTFAGIRKAHDKPSRAAKR
jgi:hypothetical protein